MATVGLGVVRCGDANPAPCGVRRSCDQSPKSFVTAIFSPPASVSIASNDGFALPRSIRLI
jgi:hypothetical protein